MRPESSLRAPPEPDNGGIDGALAVLVSALSEKRTECSSRAPVKPERWLAESPPETPPPRSDEEAPPRVSACGGALVAISSSAAPPKRSPRPLAVSRLAATAGGE